VCSHLCWCLLAGHSPPPPQRTVRWYPVHSNLSEGLYIYLAPSTAQPVVVKIEALVDDKPSTTEGTPTGDTSFLAAPIGNLDTYRIKTLTVDVGGARWVLRNPKAGDESVLESASGVSRLSGVGEAGSTVKWTSSM
jgi:hypothetical protein